MIRQSAVIVAAVLFSWSVRAGVAQSVRKDGITPGPTIRLLKLFPPIPKGRWSAAHEFWPARGEIQNLTDRPLKDVTIEISWFSSSGQKLATENVRIAGLSARSTAAFFAGADAAKRLSDINDLARLRASLTFRVSGGPVAFSAPLSRYGADVIPSDTLVSDNVKAVPLPNELPVFANSYADDCRFTARRQGYPPPLAGIDKLPASIMIVKLRRDPSRHGGTFTGYRILTRRTVRSPKVIRRLVRIINDLDSYSGCGVGCIRFEYGIRLELHGKPAEVLISTSCNYLSPPAGHPVNGSLPLSEFGSGDIEHWLAGVFH